MHSKTFAVFCCLIVGSFMITLGEANPVANTLLTASDLVQSTSKPVDAFRVTQVGGRKGRYYGGYPYGGGYGGYPYGGGYGGYPGGGFGGSSASASASASAGGFGYGRK